MTRMASGSMPTFAFSEFLSSGPRRVAGDGAHTHEVCDMDLKYDTPVWVGYALWSSGYLDQAKQAVEGAIELARRQGTPSICVGLFQGGICASATWRNCAGAAGATSSSDSAISSDGAI